MADTKNIPDYIFKKMTNACTMYNEVNPFVSVDKKMISSHNEWYIVNVLVCAVFFFKTCTWYLLFMLYYAVI